MPVFSHAGQVQVEIQLSENRLEIAGKLYISTAGVISRAISLKFGELANSVSKNWTLLCFSLSVLRFSRYKVFITQNYLVFSGIGHSARLKNWQRVSFGNKDYKIYLNICAKFQPSRTSVSAVTELREG